MKRGSLRYLRYCHSAIIVSVALLSFSQFSRSIMPIIFLIFCCEFFLLKLSKFNKKNCLNVVVLCMWFLF